MNIKNEIYQLVGEVIELIQYIEWNLCLELNIDGFSSYTLSQIRVMISDAKISDDDTLNNLLTILNKRNDLIHQYFKRMDFVEQSENNDFLINQRNYLINFFNKIQLFNNALVETSD